jgi:hypothetical protein
MIVWKNDSDTIILKPIEIRSKRGVKKMKKTNSAIYIPNMDAKEFDKICAEKGLQFIYIPVPPHGRLIAEADAVETVWMILEGLGFRREENPKLEQTVREVYATTPTIEME